MSVFSKSAFTLGGIALLGLAACRGADVGQSALPATAVAQSEQIGAVRSARAVAAPQFVAIGPTHMSDGVPTSGKVNAFAIDPSNRRTIYMASGWGTGLETYSSAGISRTLDGGASWKPIVTGLVDRNGLVSSTIDTLWIDAAHPSVLLAGSEYDGIYRTSNRGDSWKNVYATAHVTQFAVYAGMLYAATAAGILRSSDDGASWSVALPSTATMRPTALGAVQATNGNVFLAGMSDASMWSFENGGFQKVGQLPYQPYAPSDGNTPWVHQIAVDPLSPSTVYASENDGSWDQDLFASTDAGVSWHAVLSKRYENLGLGTQAIAFSAVHPHVLYLGEDGSFYVMGGGGGSAPRVAYAANLQVIDIRDIWVNPNGSDDACWIASDQGLDYEPACYAFTNRFKDTVVSASSAIGLARRFTVSPDGKTLMVSLQDFDSHVTFDGGGTWKQSNAYLYEDGFNELRPGNPNVCYAYDEAYGLRVSTDGCRTYARASGQQRRVFPTRLMTTPIAFDPANPLSMILLSGPYPGSNYLSGAFQSANGGKTFTKLAWPFSSPGSIAVDSHAGAHMVVSDLKLNGSMFTSSLSYTTNGGKTWTSSQGVPETAFWYALAVSPTNGQTVLASSIDAANNVFVLRSTNGGRSFQQVAIVTNAPLIRGRRDRNDGDRAAGQRHNEGVESERADDERATPPQAYVYSPEREIRYNQDVTTGKADVVVTTLRGAFMSLDDGSTWQRIDTKLISHSFWGIRWVNGYLYLASDGQGILKSTVPVQTR